MSLSATGLFSNIGHYLFFGNIFIAVCAFCQCWSTCLLWQLPLPLELGLFVFFSTFLLYNFDSLLPYKLQQQVTFSGRRAWVQQHKKPILLLMAVAGGAALYLFIRTYHAYHILLLGHLVLLSLLYSLPVVPVRGSLWPLRHIPLLKIFLISYVWTSVTVWLPLLAANQNIFSEEVWWLFLRRFLFVLPITIIFDIRDLHRDKATGTVTLPGVIGVRWAKYIAWLSLVLFSVLVVLNWQEGYWAPLLLSAVATAWVVGQASSAKSEYFFAVVADGMMVLQFLLLLAFGLTGWN